MEAYSLLILVVGILLIVLQFYVEYESSGAVDKDSAKKKQDEKIVKYQDQKDKGEISLYGKIELNLELFIRSRILYKIGAILICIVIIYKVIS